MPPKDLMFTSIATIRRLVHTIRVHLQIEFNVYLKTRNVHEYPTHFEITYIIVDMFTQKILASGNLPITKMNIVRHVLPAYLRSETAKALPY